MIEADLRDGVVIPHNQALNPKRGCIVINHNQTVARGLVEAL